VFLLSVGLLVPYLLIGIMGAGATLGLMTDGMVPYWAGCLAITLVVFTYVTASGMRGTAWVNTFQTLVFMILGGIATMVILSKTGGLSGVMANLAENHPKLLYRGETIPPLYQLSYTLIPLSAGMFPHLFTHWLTAKKASSFKVPIIFYPVCMAVVWVPSVLLGVAARVTFPDLEGPATNNVLVQLVDHHASGLLAGLLAAGVIAAIMSSLDSQTLSLGNMFTQDIVRHYGLGAEDEQHPVWWGRLFVSLILGLTFVLAQVTGKGIFALGIWSFTGFASLLPIAVAAVYWKRATKWGAYASIIVTAIGWVYFYSSGSRTAWDTGMLAVAIMLPCSILAMVIGSLMTKPPKDLDRFFADR
jgi:SSS family solute:Na+ symporter